jgi:hypothetical protein
MNQPTTLPLGPRAGARLAQLDQQFSTCLAMYQASEIFSGPSVYFYEAAVDYVRQVPSLADLAGDQRLAEMIYATLTSWGMHRMGAEVRAKLTDFAAFRFALDALLAQVEHLHQRSILEVTRNDLLEVLAALIPAVTRAGLSASDSPLVANTKALHCLLPDLVPPMDRHYTYRFFFGTTNPKPNTTTVFGSIFGALHALALEHRGEIEVATNHTYHCLGHVKALDNAVVGYLLSHPKLRVSPST